MLWFKMRIHLTSTSSCTYLLRLDVLLGMVFVAVTRLRLEADEICLASTSLSGVSCTEETNMKIRMELNTYDSASVSVCKTLFFDFRSSRDLKHCMSRRSICNWNVGMAYSQGEDLRLRVVQETWMSRVRIRDLLRFCRFRHGLKICCYVFGIRDTKSTCHEDKPTLLYDECTRLMEKFLRRRLLRQIRL